MVYRKVWDKLKKHFKDEGRIHKEFFETWRKEGLKKAVKKHINDTLKIHGVK